MKQFNNRFFGFTIIELLISLAIASLFFILIGRTMGNMLSSRNKVNTNLNVQKLVDQTLLVITQEARWAAVISNTSTSLTFTTDSQQISYTRSGNNLVKTTQQLQGTPYAATENLNPPTYQVTAFTITDRSSDTNRPSYEIVLTITYKPNSPGSPTLSYTNRTALTPRNRFPGSEL